jgi:hypothetical protein
MIAYNQQGLDALLTKAAAREWHDKGLLSQEKWQAVQERYVSNFYSPNIFVRIGLAIFCLILLQASMGLVAMVVKPDSSMGFTFFALFWGAVWLLALELWAIRSARHYGSGIDEMLLYVGLGAIMGSIFSQMPYSTGTLAYFVIAWPFLFVGSLRYLDRLLAAATFICSLGIVMLTINEAPGLAIYALPFAGMLFSAAAYFFSRKGQARYEWRHWHGALAVTELLALVAFYASGNYWVVQQAGEQLFQLPAPALGGLFWVLTFGVPVLYLILGLRRKDRLMLDIGIACTGAAVFTFRYYFHVLPPAWAAVAIGAGLFVTAWWCIDYLRKNAGAYTYAADSDTNLLQEIEEQLIEQTIANQPTPAPEPKSSFGGGQFGGGGAGQDF